MPSPERLGSRRWLIDGSNVVGSRPDGWWRDRPAAFARLAEELETFAGDGEEVSVVFDGHGEQAATSVHIWFAPSADDRLVELVAADDDPSSLTVVTSDRDLAERVQRHGAAVMGSGTFRRLLDQPRPETR